MSFETDQCLSSEFEIIAQHISKLQMLLDKIQDGARLNIAKSFLSEFKSIAIKSIAIKSGRRNDEELLKSIANLLASQVECFKLMTPEETPGGSNRLPLISR